MAILDLVFEGGGAKGMVFVGALQELLQTGGHTTGRLIGTSAGAITASLLAAGYTAPEMKAALDEKENEKSVFEAFMGEPESLTSAEIRNSAIRTFLRDVNLRFVPDFLEEKLDDQIAEGLARHEKYNNVYSFVERGGWYSADAFVTWMERKLDEGQFKGQPRRFSKMTLAQFYATTGAELSVIASDTTAQRMLVLNHNTAPDLPVVWAVRMSMSIPLIWQEVIWQDAWGTYLGRNVTGNVIVDGGMLSNFPISLLLAPDPNVAKVMGKATSDYVLGLLIDDSKMVDFPAERRLIDYTGDPWQLQTVQRILRLVNTMMTAHDAAAIEVFKEHVVELPAGGYGVVEFDMSDAKRQALVDAGRTAMKQYLAARPDLFTRTRSIEQPRSKSEIADGIARDILAQP